MLGVGGSADCAHFEGCAVVTAMTAGAGDIKCAAPGGSNVWRGWCGRSALTVAVGIGTGAIGAAGNLGHGSCKTVVGAVHRGGAIVEGQVDPLINVLGLVRDVGTINGGHRVAFAAAEIVGGAVDMNRVIAGGNS